MRKRREVAKRPQNRKLDKTETTSATKTASAAPTTSVWWSRPKAIIVAGLSVIGAVTAILKLPQVIIAWLPQITVEPTKAADVTNPLSGFFAIKNEQGYPLEDLSVEAGFRCVKIGLGNDSSPIEKCPPSMIHSQPKRWTKHTLEPHEAYEINPGEALWVTPGALLYTQIDNLCVLPALEDSIPL